MIDCGTYRFDRCDRCGAQGKHHAAKGSSDLVLCNHHYRPIAASLALAGFEVKEMVTA